jgi:AraC-like DNA-binding protein
LYVPDVGSTAQIRAWRPDVPGVAEVLHAHFPDHAYPPHTHDTWTLLIVDTGVVAFELDHHEHGALRTLVTLLPPHVPHDGRSVDALGFRKRVVYLDADQVDGSLVGRAVDHPGTRDPLLRARVSALHESLRHPGDGLESESRLLLVRERLEAHLRRRVGEAVTHRDAGLARRLRDLLDARVADGIGLTEAAALLGAHPTHLVRTFGQEYGIAPHQYLTGRRLDLARRLLLDGRRPADAATEVGFFDQAHLNRHFKRLLGVTPAAYARSA